MNDYEISNEILCEFITATGTDQHVARRCLLGVFKLCVWPSAKLKWNCKLYNFY
jgi:hypothetical protein